MSLACKVSGHKWVGCKCERCGATRDKEHKWHVLEGKCEAVCQICGKTRSIDHEWNGYQCKRCGATRDGKPKLEEVLNPNDLKAGDVVRLFSTSLPFTFSSGWFGGALKISSIDFDEKRIFFADLLSEELSDRGFGDTIFGFNGSLNMHCYRVNEEAHKAGNKDSVDTKNLTADQLIDYIVAHRSDPAIVSLFSQLSQKLQDGFYSDPKSVEKAILTFGDSGMASRYNLIRDSMQPSDLDLLIPELAQKYIIRYR